MTVGAELVEGSWIDAVSTERGKCIFCHVPVAAAQIRLLADVDLFRTEILGFDTENLGFQA